MESKKLFCLLKSQLESVVQCVSMILDGFAWLHPQMCSRGFAFR